MRFDPTSLNVLADDGTPLGHIIDAIRNGTVDAAEAKGKLDMAWIAREQQHAAELSSLIERASVDRQVYEEARARTDLEHSTAIEKLQAELDDCLKEYVAGNMDHG